MKMVILIKIIFLGVFAGLTGLHAQMPARHQAAPVALKGGTIVTVSGETIPGGTVVFENGVITSVGVNAEIPAGSEIVDITGKYVFPAMIHARTSLGLSEISRLAETVDLSEHGNINPNVRAQVAFHAESDHIPIARTHGIAVAVATPTGGIISGLSAAMLTDGWNWEEMLYRAPVAMVINWPNMANARARDNALEELAEAFSAARRYKKAIEASGEQGVPHHARDVRWEAMLPVLNGEIPVHINANEIRQIQSAITWAEKENVRMVLVGGRDAGYVLPQLKEKDIPVIVSPVISGPSRQWEEYDRSYTLPQMLYEAGIRYCIAGDFAPAYSMRLAHHPSSAVAYGLPLDEAVKTVTLYPAEVLGLDDRMGSVEVGKDASLIIADGNILELSTVIEQVYIMGRSVEMDDRHRRQYERYRERYNRMQDREAME